MPEEGRPTVSLIFPTYCEEGAIGTTLDGVATALDAAGITWEALIVDDASPDGTQDEVLGRQAQYGERVRLIVRHDERGLGSAVVRGFRDARGEHLLVMDADGQHPADAAVRMVQEAEAKRADIVIGTRHSGGGSVGSFSPLRRFVSWGAAMMAHIALPPVRRQRLTDPMSGLFLVRADRVDADHLSPRGYKILLEVLAHAKAPDGGRLTVAEVPYSFGERTAGESKLGSRVMVDYIIHLLALGLRDRENRRFMEFAVVGASGVFVNLGLLAIGGAYGATAGIAYILSLIIARIAAVTWNFTWNDLFTYRDMRKHTGYNWLVRFLRFNVVSATSFGVYFGAAVLLNWLGMHYLAAGFVAIMVSVIINFKGNTDWTYESSSDRAHRRAKRRRRTQLASAE